MQPLPVPPPPITPPTEPLRPAGWWFGVAAGVGVVGVVVGVGMGVRAVRTLADRVDDFDRVPLPEGGTIEIEEAGDYTIYHEYPGADDNAQRGIIETNFGETTLTAPDGSDVPLEDYETDVSYGFGEHEGVAVYSFEAPEAGNYELSADGGPGNAAVGPGIGRGLVGGVLLALGIGFGSIGLAVVFAVVVAIRRGQDRRRREVLGHRGPWTDPPLQ